MTVRAIRTALASALVVAACTAPATVATSSPTPIPSPSPTESPTARPAVREAPLVPSDFTRLAASDVDLAIAPGVAPEDAQRIAETADVVAPKIEEAFKRTYTYRPTIYVFSDEQQAADRLVQILGMTAEQAAREAKHPGFAVANWIVVIIWEHVKDETQLYVVPHELTHVAVGEYDPRRSRVPPWLDEGLGRLAELMLPAMEWRDAEITYTTASMATTGTLFMLPGLAGSIFQTYRDPVEIAAAYAEAAQATRYLRDEIGQDGIVRMLELIGEGASFRVAYLRVTGKLTGNFEDDFPPRAAQIAPGAGIAITASAPTGIGPFALAYGFPPKTTLNLVASNAAGRSTATGTTSPYGTAAVLLDPLPAGSYTVVATAGAARAVANVTVSR